ARVPTRSTTRGGTEHLSDRLDSGFSAVVGAIVRLRGGGLRDGPRGNEYEMALFVPGLSEIAAVETCAVEIEGEAMPVAATVVEDSLGPDELSRQALEDGAEVFAVDGCVDSEGPGSVCARGPDIVVGCGHGLCRAGRGGLIGEGREVTGDGCLALDHLAVGHRRQPVPDLGDLIGGGEVGLRQNEPARPAQLGGHGVADPPPVHLVPDGQDVDAHGRPAAHEARVISPPGHDIGLSDPADFDEDGSWGWVCGADALDRRGHAVGEVAADAAVGDLPRAAVPFAQDPRVDVDLTEVVDDHGDATTVAAIEHLVEQRRLSRAAVPADDGQGDACHPAAGKCRPPTTVPRTTISRSSAGPQESGSRSRIAKSANFPASSEPMR